MPGCAGRPAGIQLSMTCESCVRRRRRPIIPALDRGTSISTEDGSIALETDWQLTLESFAGVVCL
ncbi:hypothetical protein K458DRAFT_421878 [Lentithecium fluviatile CBS 122367]|uniref:Uncharacterized protein n=1 Tax=Lentithecium fluviatile CBS 122367 TaxID=1168545 RepID=A0A6G1IQ51_9PLEO|nr:hypothetical protein K458DRAFT_421878 [Lentithecium fluviatile CBS 122367]